MMDLDWKGFPGCRALDELENDAVQKTLKKGTLYRGIGFAPEREVEVCENILAQGEQRKHCLLFNSGTSALLSALKAAGVGSGDEVIVPAYGWISILSSILFIGAIPVFIPTKSDLTLDVTFLKRSISPKSKVIIPIHACGNLCELDPIMKIAQSHNLTVIDDACQCIGGQIGGPLNGVKTDATILSFQSFKVITSGEGGALITDNDTLYEKAVRFHDAGLIRFAQHLNQSDSKPVGIGLNLRMNEITAAVLKVQIQKLPKILKDLKEKKSLFIEAFSPLLKGGDFSFIQQPDSLKGNHAFLVLEAKDCERANKLISFLQKNGYPFNVASQAPLHALPGWLTYLQDNQFTYRSIEENLAIDILKKIIIVEINYLMDSLKLAELRKTLDSFMKT